MLQPSLRGEEQARRVDDPEGSIFLPFERNDAPSIAQLREAFVSLQYEPREILALMRELYPDAYPFVSDRLKFTLLQGRGLETIDGGEMQLDARGNHYDAILELEV